MERSFSLKACLLTFCVLMLVLSAFVYSKKETRPSSSESLHTVLIPLNVPDEDPIITDNNATKTDNMADQVLAEETPLQKTSPQKTPIDQSKAVIALVIYDYGLSQTRSQALFDAQIENLTLSLSPYSERPSQWIETAHRFSAEPWTSLYIAQKTHTDSGPLTILEGQQKEQNAKRFSLTLEHGSGSAGLIGYYEGKHGIKEISTIYKTLQDTHTPFALFSHKTLFPPEDVMQSPLTLGYNKTSEEIEDFLDTLKDRALKEGAVFGALPPTPLVLKQLKIWHQNLNKASIQIIPLSRLQDYLS